jgi:hypothetical protein
MPLVDVAEHDWGHDPLQDLGVDEQLDQVYRRPCDRGAERDMEREQPPVVTRSIT